MQTWVNQELNISMDNLYLKLNTKQKHNNLHEENKKHKDKAQQYIQLIDCIWNLMAHMQKPEIVFWQNGWVHLNQRGRQFSRLLAAEVCTSAVVMLDTPCSKVVLSTLFASFLFTSPPVCHCVPSHFNWTLLHITHAYRICRQWTWIIKKPMEQKCWKRKLIGWIEIQFFYMFL